MAKFDISLLPPKDREHLSKAVSSLSNCEHELWLAFFKNDCPAEISQASVLIHDALVLIKCVI
jgi:hypothetical protein